MKSGINEILVARKIQYSAAAAAEVLVLDFGTKEILVASRSQRSAGAAAELRVSGAGHFQLAPRPKYKNSKYKKIVVGHPFEYGKAGRGINK